ncbi:LytR family transcriptional regulator [Bacillus lacus]|uniref:Polyisoprenyl-teichoic acid--peptidoglycan teichoic acid transferase TagU n=1 Tax=Metabacillus lacus TaxID=1983721 RepID=A0A7X2J1Q4_9BACI|nr:LytR family transcriptional regulator [Metabacillus lacus]MRX73664.1 LytR family transcriptional regulator [Metabacillus lacus]
MRVKKRKSRKKKWLLISAGILGLFILVTGSYAFYLFKSATDTINTIQEDIGRDKSDKRTDIVDTQKKQPISVLLMGVDERDGDRGRSDSLIYMTVNPNKKNIDMVSIPRDTRTEIIGRGKEDKINHAYAFGGTEMAVRTVEHFLDVPVDYFVKINMESFRDIVNAVGGVEVDNDLEFTYDGETFKKGRITLNGDSALKYTRMRYDDSRGDFGRQLRQRQVIEAVIKKGADISSIAKFGDMFKVVQDNVTTNLTFNDMWSIQSNYKEAQNNIVQHQISGSGKKIDRIYYYIVPEEERLALSDKLKESLEVTPATASFQSN